MQIKNDLKNTFTSYWEFLTLRTACQLNVFDFVGKGSNTFELLLKQTKSHKKTFEKLLIALIDLETIFLKNKQYYLTKKGLLLTENHPESMKQACILWGNEHLSAWQNLKYTIQTGKPVFENLYELPFFDYLKYNQPKLFNYHRAMEMYAKDDYKYIFKVIDFSQFNTIADIGGGLGVLINVIDDFVDNKTLFLLELKEVIDLIVDKKKTINYIKGDFFKPFNFSTDIIFLSRILHDWNDEKCATILNNCYISLNKNGKLLILEILQDEVSANLLSLNMMLITNSFERTYNQYKVLLLKNNFKIIDRKKLNNLQTVLIAEKK